MNPPFKTVKMFGPCLKDPSKIINRDVPEADVRAYKASGYQLGSVEEAVETVVEVVIEKPKAKKKSEGIDRERVERVARQKGR